MTPVAAAAVVAYAARANRDCCAFVAVWVFAHLYPAPADPTDQAAWAALDRVAWRGLNVRNPGDVWSCPDTAARLLGGRILMDEDLIPGCWHVVQHWNGQRTRGHAYLVRPEPDGRFTVDQSSADLGHRVEIRAWWHPAGVDVRVAALPPEVG